MRDFIAVTGIGLGNRTHALSPHFCLTDYFIRSLCIGERGGRGRSRPCIVASSTKERLRKLLSSSVCAAALLVASIKTVGVCLCLPISDRVRACVRAEYACPDAISFALTIRFERRGSGVILNLSPIRTLANSSFHRNFRSRYDYLRLFLV